jgi:hypothetical protein
MDLSTSNKKGNRNMLYKRGVVIRPSEKETKEFHDSDLIEMTVQATSKRIQNDKFSTMASLRKSGNFANKAIYLNSAYIWDIVTDSSGYIVAVPIKKVK